MLARLRVALACCLCLTACVAGQSPGRATYPKVSVRVHETNGYSPCQRKFAIRAAGALEKVLNSKEFRDQVLEGDFNRTNGDTAGAVLDKILGGVGSDHNIDLHLRTINDADGLWLENCEFDSASGTIGIDGGCTGVAATCSNWITRWMESEDLGAFAGHLLHEYLHRIGYSHSGPRKLTSAVYHISMIAEDLVGGQKAVPTCP